VAGPAVPAAEQWKLSIGAVLSRHPAVPAKLGKVLSLLDRLGAISIGPESFGFDGDEIEWDKITEVRVRTAGDFAMGAVLDFGIDELGGMLPPVPGRKWAVTKVTGLMLALASSLAKQVEEEPDDQQPAVIPCEIVYRGRIRKKKDQKAGLFSGSVLATAPAISAALLENIVARKIPVVAAQPHELLVAASQRGEALRKQVARLRQREVPDDAAPELMADG
jgi:hypothetical protein